MQDASVLHSLGRKVWAIAEGYIPSSSTGPDPHLTSHETSCLLNPSNSAAHVKLDIIFEDREPLGPFLIEVPARRTLHVRFNDLRDPGEIPRDTPYSSVFVSDVPIVVQHTRLDSRQAANALLTTMAFPGDV